jgi:tetratricopeptide (TPR) repeat protein
MDLALDPGSQTWPQLFHQLVIANNRYWLKCVQENVKVSLREAPQMLKALRYALSLPEAWEPARDLMLRLNPLMIRQGHGIAWEDLLIRGIKRSSERQDPAEIELRLGLGNFYRLQGRLSEARDCLQEALVLCEQYQEQVQERTLLNYLGLVTRLSGQHNNALAYSQQVLADPNLTVFEEAEALNVMGLVAFDGRRWEEALGYFERALALYRQVNNLYEIARILNNQGLVLLRNGQLDRAEECYREAISQFRAAEDQIECFKAVMNLGNVFLMKQNYKAAIRQYQEALPTFQRYNYIFDLAYIYNNLGLAYTGAKEWEIAESYFLAAVEIWQDQADSYNLTNVLDNLGDMFIKANQLKKADEILARALQMLDTMPDGSNKIYLQQEIKSHLYQIKTKSEEQEDGVDKVED